MCDMTLNRDQIKGIAMVTMCLNHISQIFMTPGTFWAEVFLDLGWFTAITMCYFLVEGYGYTHDKRRYALRLGAPGAGVHAAFCLGARRRAETQV